MNNNDSTEQLYETPKLLVENSITSTIQAIGIDNQIQSLQISNRVLESLKSAINEHICADHPEKSIRVISRHESYNPKNTLIGTEITDFKVQLKFT